MTGNKEGVTRRKGQVWVKPENMEMTHTKSTPNFGYNKQPGKNL